MDEATPQAGQAARDVDCSIVLPVYFNEGSLTSTLQAIREDVIQRNPGLRFEVVFVDDGSGDGSLAELLRLREEDPGTVVVVKLSRNFGQINALRAGFETARGRCIICLSADGQDPPSLMNDMLKAHLEEGCDIVAGAREGRDESWFRIVTSRLAYGLVRKLAFPKMPEGGFDYVLMSRRAMTVFLKNREAHPFFQGQVMWIGMKMKFIGYHRRERTAGRSRWSTAMKLTYLIDAVLSYSFVPLRIMSLVGMVVAALGMLYAAFIFVARLFGGIPVQGWAPLMIVILVLGGIQMLMLGVLGEYMWRILAQVRNREPYVIDRIIDESGERSA